MRDEIITFAERCSRQSGDVNSDLGARLFPRTDHRFSDRTVAFAKSAHRALIGAVEGDLLRRAVDDFGASESAVPGLAAAGDPQCLPLVDGSDLSRHGDYLQFLHVRALEHAVDERQRARCAEEGRDYIGFEYLLDDDDAAIADAAMGMLVALHDWRLRTDMMQLAANDVPADLLYLIVWRVAAALTMLSPGQEKAWSAATEQLLAEHDESVSLVSRAMQLAQARLATGATSGSPDEIGAPLFIAQIALRSGLDYDQVVLATADGPTGRLPVILRALGCNAQSAATAIEQLVGHSEYLSLSAYDAIDEQTARELVAGWSSQSPLKLAKQAMRGIESV